VAARQRHCGRWAEASRVGRGRVAARRICLWSDFNGHHAVHRRAAAAADHLGSRTYQVGKEQRIVLLERIAGPQRNVKILFLALNSWYAAGPQSGPRGGVGAATAKLGALRQAQPLTAQRSPGNLAIPRCRDKGGLVEGAHATSVTQQFSCSPGRPPGGRTGGAMDIAGYQHRLGLVRDMAGWASRCSRILAAAAMSRYTPHQGQAETSPPRAKVVQCPRADLADGNRIRQRSARRRPDRRGAAEGLDVTQ